MLDSAKAPELDLVSVIIPCHNIAKYSANLDAIFQQTYKEIEVILIDDKSTDNTWDELQSFQQKYQDKRVIIHRNEVNLRAGKTRDLGVKISSGRFICFWDVDDQIESNFIEKMLLKLNQEQSDFVCCGYRLYRDNSDEQVFLIRDQLLSASSIYELHKLVFKFYVMPWNKLIRRDFLVNNHIEFPDLYCSEDVFWNLQLVLKAKAISFVNEPLYNYFQRQNTLSTSVNDKVLASILSTLVLEYEYFQNLNNDELSAIWRDYCSIKVCHYWEIFRVDDNLLKQFAQKFYSLSQAYGIKMEHQKIPVWACVRWYRLIPLKKMRMKLKQQFYHYDSIRRRNLVYTNLLRLAEQC